MNENQRVRIIVICGDTTSFGSWGTRTGDDQKHFSSFMSPFVELLNNFRKKHGCFVSQVADGFVAILEMKEGHNCHLAIKAIKMGICIKKKVQRIVNRMNHPKPAGFRVRINCGWGWKWDLNGKGDYDYFSPTINTTHKLLRVNKHTPVICHESVKELMSFRQIKQSGVKMTKIVETDQTPPGVNQEDMDLLWEISIKN